MARERSQYRGLDDGPRPDDQVVVESEGLVASDRCHRITASVSTSFDRSSVELFTVGFEDDAPGDHEVDPSDAIDDHLALQRDSEQMKPQTQEGFQSAVGVVAGEVDKPARGRRKARAEAAQ